MCGPFTKRKKCEIINSTLFLHTKISNQSIIIIRMRMNKIPMMKTSRIANSLNAIRDPIRKTNSVTNSTNIRIQNNTIDNTIHSSPTYLHPIITAFSFLGSSNLAAITSKTIANTNRTREIAIDQDEKLIKKNSSKKFFKTTIIKYIFI